MTLDFLNQNSLRNYPIADDLDRVSDDGMFTIPNTLIVDLSLSSAGGWGSTFYISGISNRSNNLSIEISVAGVLFGTFSTALPNTSSNFNLALVPGPMYPDAVGVITIGSTGDLAMLPSGDFTFSVGATQLLARCSTVGNAGITRITFTDIQGNNFTLSGHVTLNANSNLQFYSANDGVTVNMNAGENLGLNKQCTNTPSPILTINGVSPDSTGNFNLISDPGSCITIAAVQYGAVITDACGKPCLGCASISTLTTLVNGLESDIFTLRDFANSMQSLITQANTLIGYQCIT